MQQRMSKVQLFQRKRKKFETNIRQMTLVSFLLVKLIQNNLNSLQIQLPMLLLSEGKKRRKKKSFGRLLQFWMHQIIELLVTQMIQKLLFTAMKCLRIQNENQNEKRKRVKRKRIKTILFQVLQRLQNPKSQLQKHPKRNLLSPSKLLMNHRMS